MLERIPSDTAVTPRGQNDPRDDLGQSHLTIMTGRELVTGPPFHPRTLSEPAEHRLCRYASRMQAMYVRPTKSDA
jgi:hypothetical protein